VIQTAVEADDIEVDQVGPDEYSVTFSLPGVTQSYRLTEAQMRAFRKVLDSA